MHSDDWLLLCRTVRFGDTDAAGVVHFVRLLQWCHEAYEESLERFGLVASAVFPTPAATPEVALPIVHCSADFRRPLVCGDPLAIALEPRRLDPGSFEVTYRFSTDGQMVAQGLTRHLAIRADNRGRCSLSEPINRWLEASSLANGVQPL
ncbi:MAG: acyl-CoA thioesterase [Cyanobacteria bacterium K_DeepCast_35m_m2_023]|nr:acyl-CoA thioesterase [Cyanobacteria bacterium K_DeepCast_35m_m2_023]